MILDLLDESLTGHVLGKNSGTDTWRALSDHFDGKAGPAVTMTELQRHVSAPNEMIYADLLFPGQHNRTQFSAVLVILDAFSKFVSVFLLKSKTQDEVNMHIQQYIRWAERQTCRVCVEGDEVTHRVKKTLTDRGTEFVNHASEQWYADAGIVHVKVGSKSSHLNPCERVHQTLVGMVKAMMEQSGLPSSLWPEALYTAAYIKQQDEQ
ncbi:TPA: hypothetical protein N0F65_001674 [Lagenidium giganteum]|uniref:Integrase catalytic domain-containing protein n=1 Tax=Lagenidium giganteum TaxID=4803 RepID=A0AAV2Z191_9STRA|nr:TPA: hypothetical protein N0F65_001674 [Lagenidium giganteum]